MEIAGQQGARFWELRCAMSLARLRMGAGRSAEALADLKNVSGSFTEGAEIADMRTARELMAQLRN
jgi:predicted ATPase